MSITRRSTKLTAADSRSATLLFLATWFERIGTDANLRSHLTVSDLHALTWFGRAATNTLNTREDPAAALKQFRSAVATQSKTGMSPVAEQLARRLVDAVEDRASIDLCLESVINFLDAFAPDARREFEKSLNRALSGFAESGKESPRGRRRTAGMGAKRTERITPDTESSAGIDTLRVPPKSDTLTLEGLQAKMRAAIEKAGLTQQTVGERMGHSAKRARLNVQKLLTSADPSLFHVNRLASACGMTLIELLSLPVG